MSGLNGKEFYGYSPQMDPELASTTENFEFRYMRPEYIERAIQRIRLEQIADVENAPLWRQNTYHHQPSTTNQAMAQGNPHKHVVTEAPTKRDSQIIRDLTKQEIENLIRKAKARQSPRKIQQQQLQSQASEAANQITLDSFGVDLKEAQCLTKNANGKSKISPRGHTPKEINFDAVEHISLAFQGRQHSPSPTQTTSPLRSPRTKTGHGSQRPFSRHETSEKYHQEQKSPKPITDLCSPTTTNNFVSTASSRLMSPRREFDHELQQLNKEQSSSTSPRNPTRPVFVSTGTSPLISPRRGILRKLSTDNVPCENLNKTYNLQLADLNPSCNQTFNIEEYREVTAQVPQIYDNIRMEEYQKPTAKWVEIEETTKENRNEHKVISQSNKFSRPETARSSHNDSYTQNSSKPMMKRQQGVPNLLPTLLMTEVINNNVRLADGCFNVSPQNTDGLLKTVETIILEDSDTEIELRDRSDYTKQVKTKPMQKDMMDINVDQDEAELAEFLELERGVNDMEIRYLRNVSPLSFTEITEDEPHQTSNPIQIYINNKLNASTHRTTSPGEDIEIPLTTPDPEFYFSNSLPTQKERKRRGKSLREEHLQQTFERLARGGRSRECPPCPSNSTADNLQQPTVRTCRDRISHSCSPVAATRRQVGDYTNRGPLTTKDKSKNSARRRVVPTTLRVSKSIENQKSEKTLIFQKMTDIQVKIIEILNKLRTNLLELHSPKNVFEKSKRQKNALEFAVRFSRNFLYPLKGLLQELESTPVEQFNSLYSNDACNRVCYIYNLLLQSLTTYQKQLRYFHLDHVPQKLPTLIEIIHTTTVLCLEKNIFSRQDERIIFLQQSCNKFLDFLQELQDGHLNTARENYRKLTLEKASPKYELKMVMNPLNMYEPKLVPKVGSITARSKAKESKNKRHLASVAIEETKDEVKEKPQEDKIPTHIQTYAVEEKSSNELQAESKQQLNLGSGDGIIPGLDKSVLEAMRTMTQEQVRQILEPILKTLSTALGQQNNPEMFEAILSAFNSKVFTPTTDGSQLMEENNNKCSPEQPNVIAPATKDTAWRSQALDGAESTCKPLKVANRTKTLSQQNSRRPAVATNRKHSANAITTTTATSNVAAATAGAAAVVIASDDDDDDDSLNANHNISGNTNHNNNNTNNRTKLNAKNLTVSSNKQNSTGPLAQRVCENVGALLTHATNEGELMAAINREESQINKWSFKLMNEVVCERNTTTTTHKQVVPSEDNKQQQQYTTPTSHTNKNPHQTRTLKRATKQDRDRNRLRRSRQQRQTNKFPCTTNSSSHSNESSNDYDDSDDDEDVTANTQQQQRNKNLTPLSLYKQQKHLSKSFLTTHREGERFKLHSPRSLHTLPSHGKHTQEQVCHSLETISPQPPPPPVPLTLTPTPSRGRLMSSSPNTDESDNAENANHMLLRKMPLDLLKIHIPLTSSASLLRTERRNDKESAVNGEVDADNQYGQAGRSASVADCGEISHKKLTLCTRDSCYDDTPINTSLRLRPLPEKEMRKLKPSPKASTTHFKVNQPKSKSNTITNDTKAPKTTMEREEFKNQSTMSYNEMIQERDRFLKACEKNRFYKNPNFAEPWKIFSLISERVLNDILDTVEVDFNDGVTKFVEDFLELETKAH